METKSKTCKKYDTHTMACIQSAYEDLQLMIEEIFTSVKAIPIQLSFNEFILLFEQYDWQDIINCIEDLHAIEHIDNLRSVYNYLRKLIIEDESIVMIHDITQNSYIQENF